MAYTVNAGYDSIAVSSSATGGSAATISGENPADGVCFDAAATTINATNGIVRVNQDYLDSNDGSSYTLLTSENNQAQLWTVFSSTRTFEPPSE